MGTVVNVSAGSLLLRQQTAPLDRSGEGRKGHVLAAAVPRGSCSSPGLTRAVPQPSLLQGGSQGYATTHTRDAGAKDALPGSLSSRGWGGGETSNKKPLQLCCTRNALMLFYPGILMAPRANTASLLARAASGSSRCKTSWEGQPPSTWLFLQRVVSLQLEGLRQWATR